MLHNSNSLIVVILGQQVRVAQYCTNLEYSSALTDILQLLSKRSHLKLKQRISKVQALSFEQYQACFERATEKISKSAEPKELQRLMRKFHPHLDSQFGVEILNQIYDGEVTHIKLDIQLVANSLNCPCVYLIDLDINQFQIYSGVNTQPLGPDERFRLFNSTVNGVQPVKFVIGWELSKLPNARTAIADFETAYSITLGARKPNPLQKVDF